MTIDVNIAQALTEQTAAITAFATEVASDVTELEAKVTAGEDIAGIVAGIKANTQKIAEAAIATGNLVTPPAAGATPATPSAPVPATPAV